MPCMSASPLTLAWAWTKPTLFLRLLWERTNSIDFCMIACLLCRKSSDWRANEKEWSDSAGNRCRSSSTGDVGPLTKNCAVEADLDADLEADLETDLDERPDKGRVAACCNDGGVNSSSSTMRVGAREEGALRIRRRPEAEMPPSWSCLAFLCRSGKHNVMEVVCCHGAARPFQIVYLLCRTRVEGGASALPICCDVRILLLGQKVPCTLVLRYVDGYLVECG